MAEGKHEASMNNRKAGPWLLLTEAHEGQVLGQVTVLCFARLATSFFFQLMHVGLVSGEKEEFKSTT